MSTTDLTALVNASIPTNQATSQSQAKTTKAKNTNNASDIALSLNKILDDSAVNNSELKIKDIETLPDLYKAIDKGLIKELQIVDTNDYSENHYSKASYEVLITAKNEKSLLPWKKVQKKVYIGNRSEAEIARLELYCQKHNIKSKIKQFNASQKATEKILSQVLIAATPVLIGAGIFASVKQYNLFKLKSSFPSHYRENFGNPNQRKLIGERTRDEVLGYSEKIYLHLDQVDHFCKSFSNSSKKNRAMDVSGSAFLTGPPGTGKTYLADLTANHIIDEAKKAGKYVHAIDMSEIIEEFASFGSQAQVVFKAKPSARDIARLILEDAERKSKGKQTVLVIRCDDAGVSGNEMETEIASTFLTEVLKQMRGILSNAQDKGMQVSENKGFLGFLGFGKKEKKPTSIETIAVEISTNAERIGNAESYSKQALLDRLGAVIPVGDMNTETRLKFTKENLAKCLKKDSNQIPPDFLNFICALTSSYNRLMGASIRDYVEEGNFFSQLKSKLGSDPIAKMRTIGAEIKNWKSPGAELKPETKRFIDGLMVHFDGKNRCLFKNAESLQTYKQLFFNQWAEFAEYNVSNPSPVFST